MSRKHWGFYFAATGDLLGLHEYLVRPNAPIQLKDTPAYVNVQLDQASTVLVLWSRLQARDCMPPSDEEDPTTLKEITPPKCPKCDNRAEPLEMVMRQNRTDGSIFWGCPAYPRCTTTQKYKRAGKTMKKELVEAFRTDLNRMTKSELMDTAESFGFKEEEGLVVAELKAPTRQDPLQDKAEEQHEPLRVYDQG